LTLGVISVWDCSLPATLKGVVPRSFSRVFVSAIEGAEKFDGKLFLRAAEVLGTTPSQIIHIGDEVDSDILGAAKAGMPAVLLDRHSAHPTITSCRVESLKDFPELFEQRFSLIQSPKS
jgi:FMN phosphatase YigB (HAD superfamily)